MQQDKKEGNISPSLSSLALGGKELPIDTIAIDPVTLLDPVGGVEHGDGDAHGGVDEDECHGI